MLLCEGMGRVVVVINDFSFYLYMTDIQLGQHVIMVDSISKVAISYRTIMGNISSGFECENLKEETKI